MDLTGRTIMVTGAGQGIGRAVASMACELGANVVLIDRNAATLKEAVAALGEERALGLCVICRPRSSRETMSVEMWRDGDIVSFRAFVRARNVKALDNGKAVLQI